MIRRESTFTAPTAEEVFGGTDFPFGRNAPQDSHDLHRLSGITGLSSTLKEKQRASPQRKETNAPFDFGDLCEYVRTAYQFLEQQGKPENWHSPLFEFAPFVKAHPEMTDLPDHQAVRRIEQLMREWEGPHSGQDPWQFFFSEVDGTEAARLDFMSSWNAVRHLPFHNPLSNALRLADQRPLPEQTRGVLYQRFISIAAWLQVLFPEKPILLPTRKVGELLGCDQRTVSRLRGFAVQDGLLIIVKKHFFRPAGRNEATEFRFAIERYPDLLTRTK